MEKNPLLLPGAVVLAGAFIGAGLFFGLRDRRSESAPSREDAAIEETAAAPGAGARELPARPSGGAEIMPPPAPPAPELPSAELQSKVQKQAAESLRALRTRILKECWEPSVKNEAAPARITLQLRFLFDAKGQIIGSSVNDPQERSRLDVSQCVRDMKLPVTVSPPGQTVGVQVELPIP
jgi:hypothetical protein